MKTAKEPAHLRFAILRDLAEILAIEADSFDYPWTEEDFVRQLRQRNAIAMVAEMDGRIAGYAVFALNAKHLTLLNIAVEAGWRRMGIGRQMIHKLAGKLHAQRRTDLRLHVMETNLGGQVFFRACGFRAVAIKDAWFNTDEPAYEMELNVEDYLKSRPCERPEGGGT